MVNKHTSTTHTHAYTPTCTNTQLNTNKHPDKHLGNRMRFILSSVCRFVVVYISVVFVSRNFADDYLLYIQSKVYVVQNIILLTHILKKSINSAGNV